MAREIRILHTADTHLGYKQYHSEARRMDFFAAFELVVNDAVEMQVDAVVHAGDLFDSRNPTLEDLLETMSLLSRLKAADIPFLGIVGNHESKQNTQWLDLFEEMRLAARLGKKPHMVGNVAIYGIDSVPKSKIPIFDYSGFSPAENCWKLLVMHQIMSPFPYAEWDCDEVLENLPFRVDAVLLGDYHEHAITKNKTGETWITYPGSTERNSISEKYDRSYNIITLSEKGLEISKRTIPTRKFLPIKVELTGEDKPYEQIFSTVNEYFEEIPDSVVFLEISGDSEAVLSLSELEEYLLSKGALVPRVNDLRIKESLPEEILKVSFSDPDHAVANEIKNMSLNDGGLIIDEIVRSPSVPRSRVDEETEGRLSKLIEAMAVDFKCPDFRIEIPACPASSASFSSPLNPSDPSNLSSPVMKTEISAKAEFAGEAGFAGESRPAGIIARKLEITELSEILRTSDKIENAEPPSNLEFLKLTDSDSGSLELSNGFIVPYKSVFPQETSGTSGKSPGTGIEFLKYKDNEPETKLEGKPETKPEGKPETKLEGKPEIKPEGKSEIKPDSEPESEFSESKPETEIQKLAEPGVKGKSGKETSGKAGKLPEEKLVRATELGKKGKTGQKKGKGRSAVPRQYNLGDYL
ncbi:MAG: exonuclease SbcCD subunit D [Methanosarcina sp.]|nr:exonuclease SbcCD subunit D [Methanosarcina sp.]